MNAYELLSQFAKSGQFKDLREAMRALGKYNLEAIEGTDPPCDTCIFNSERIKSVQNMFSEDVLGPSHCFLSNAMFSAYKFENDAEKNGTTYIVSCFSSKRENWIEPPNSKKRFSINTMRADSFDNMFDTAKFYTELVKYIAAFEEVADVKEEK